MHYDVIGISDLHLGARNSELKKIRRFLHKLKKGKHFTAETLIIMGDGVDKADLKKLKHKHWKVLSLIEKLQKKMNVVWLKGNHDPELEVIEREFNIRAMPSYVFRSGTQKVFVAHGDKYDEFLDKHPIVTNMADAIYAASQMIDPTHSLAKLLKKRSKKFIKAAKKINVGIAREAAAEGCTIAWHGHSHHAGTYVVDGVHVWDSGCWTERPCTYLTIKQGIVEQHQYK